MHPLIEKKKKEIYKICKSLNVKHLYAFGSIVKQYFTESDEK